MYFGIPNLSSAQVTKLEKPQDYKSAKSVTDFANKQEFRKWCSDFATQHMFISGYEGVAANIRVTYDKGNPPFMLHHIIVDYDAPISVDTPQFLAAKPQSEFRPSWLVRTYSDNARLVFDLEKPLMVSTKEQVKKFMTRVVKELRLVKWLAGLEAEAVGDPAKYYEIGKQWTKLEGVCIPADFAMLWLYEASRNMVLETGVPQHKVPLEVVAKEVNERFPGRWAGRFEEGCRGIRFWDPVADNSSSAIVRPDGMQCFTGPEPFVSWRKLFGSAFVDAFEADKIAPILDMAAYDGRVFWVNENSNWNFKSTSDFSQAMRLKGFHSDKRGGAAYSEVDQVEYAIKTQRRVTRAVPLLFMKQGIVRLDGETVLNLSVVRPEEPAPPFTVGKATWADGPHNFSWTWKILSNLFHDDSNPEEGVRQLNHFLAWFKYFYCNSLAGSPKPGHAVFVVGPKNKGKTLIFKHTFGPAMGADPKDATQHLVNGDRWTNQLATSPFMIIDDSEAASDYKTWVKFTSRLKKYVANAQMVFDQKFRDAGQIPWFGRIVALANDDSESLRVIPNMDVNTKDKILLFKASPLRMQFPVREDLEAALAKERPFFLRFIVDWEYPEETLNGDHRFGVTHYQHPDLLEESLQQGHAGVVLELLATLIETYKGNHKDMHNWVGTATVLFAELAGTNPGAMKELGPRSLAIALGVLAKNGYNVMKSRDEGSRIPMWTIGFDLAAGKPLLRNQRPMGESERVYNGKSKGGTSVTTASGSQSEGPVGDADILGGDGQPADGGRCTGPQGDGHTGGDSVRGDEHVSGDEVKTEEAISQEQR